MATLDATPFESLEALRAEHGRLLRASKTSISKSAEKADLASEVVGFLARARATGAKLDFPADREAAQSVLDYWTATLFTLPNGLSAAQTLPSAIPGITAEAVNLQLADFDRATLGQAWAAADDWLAGQTPELQVLARRMVLRLTRLQADGTRFEAVPTVRAALLDLHDPEPVTTVLEQLATAGVIRVTRGETVELDRMALRSSDLLNTGRR